MRRFKKVVVCVLMMFVLFSNIVVMAAESRTAEVVSFDGDVRLIETGKEKETDIIVGMLLSQGDIIMTGKDSELTLLIDTDKEIIVGEKSYLTLEELIEDEEGQKTGLRLFAGKIWSKITSKLSGGDSYEIRTPNSIMGARGTKYVVGYDIDADLGQGKSHLTVIEGTVSAKHVVKELSEDKDDELSQEDSEYPVSAGELLAFDAQVKPSPDEAVKAIDFSTLDTFTLNTVIKDVRDNPLEYTEPDFLVERLEEVLPIVEEREREEEAEDEAQIEDALGQLEGGIIYDPPKPPVEEEPPPPPVEETSTSTSSSSSSGGSSSSVVRVTNLQFTTTSTTMSAGEGYQVVYEVLPSNADNKKVNWSTSASGVAQVNTSGYITAISDGSATITGTTDDQNKQMSILVTVSSGTIPVTAIDVTPDTIYLYDNMTKTLTATLTPNNATDTGITWSTPDDIIATVDSSGLVMPVTIGSTSVTATSNDGSFQDTCAVEVVNKATLITSEDTFVVGETEKQILPYQIAGGEVTSVTFASSDESIFTVEDTGIYQVAIISGNISTTASLEITGVSIGTASLTIAALDDSVIKTVDVEIVSPVVATGIDLTASSRAIELGLSPNLDVTFDPVETTNKNYTLTSSDENITAITDNVAVGGIALGEAVITATSESGSKTDAETLYTVQPTASKQVSIAGFDENNDGYYDSFEIVTSGTIIALDDFASIDSHAELATFDIDSYSILAGGSKVKFDFTNVSYYGTGSLSDITLPDHFIIYDNYDADMENTLSGITDNARPIVEPYSTGYDGAYNRDTLLRLEFSEDVDLDLGIEPANESYPGFEIVDAVAASIPAINSVNGSGSSYELNLVNFDLGDTITVNTNNIDSASNILIQKTFILKDDGSNYYWEVQ